jgi:pimeloyl-ACP methyl ester carboxylesterase
VPRLSPWIALVCASAIAAPASAQNCSKTASAAQGVIFVADGSGDLSNTSKNLETLVCEACLPFRVERLDWSHGRLHPVTDLVKHSRHLCWGNQLAASVLAYRQQNPDGRIILVGHSSGAAIVLAAAECLPAGSVERIILLAPAVSASYDLRPALRCACEGIDSFYSKHDPILFGIFALCIGTADRHWEACGGWLGFDAPADGCGEELSCKLRQHGWSKDLWKTGYLGGHYGCRNEDHLRERVLPLLLTPSSACPAAPVPYASVWPDEPPKMSAVSAPVATEKAKPTETVVQRTGVIGNPRFGLLVAPRPADEQLVQKSD